MPPLAPQNILRALFLFGALIVTIGGCNGGSLDRPEPDASSDAGTDSRPDAEPCTGLSCPPGSTCVDGFCVVDDACDGVVCPNPGDLCRDGTCVPGAADEDGDGYAARDDCNDSDATVHPFASELCNGVDDDCAADTADGATECPDRCCDGATACRECCDASQCGPGDWSCDASYACACDGRVCAGTCYGGGVCCEAAECGTGDWRCTAGDCSCPGRLCAGTCYGGAECCTAGDCGSGDWRCESHDCRCSGLSCGGTCRAGWECCNDGDCSGDDRCFDGDCGTPCSVTNDGSMDCANLCYACTGGTGGCVGSVVVATGAIVSCRTDGVRMRCYCYGDHVD